MKFQLIVGPSSLLAALLALLAVANCAADVVMYLRFEEGSGLAAADETGFFDGELINVPDPSPGAGDTGIGWSTIVPSSIVPLTGASNTGSLHLGPVAYVDLSNGNNLYLGTNFTVEFFMMPEQPSIASVAYGFSPVSGMSLLLGNSGTQLVFRADFQGTLGSLVPASGVQTSEWSHFAITKTPGEYSMYVNGTLIASNSLPSSTDGPYFFPGTDFTGDRTIGGNSGTWRGWIDEFRISDAALTPDQFLGAFPVPEPSTCLLTLMALAILLRPLSKGWKNGG